MLYTNLKYDGSYGQIHRKDVGMSLSNILIFGKIMGGLKMLILFLFSKFIKTSITFIISGGENHSTEMS